MEVGLGAGTRTAVSTHLHISGSDPFLTREWNEMEGAGTLDNGRYTYPHEKTPQIAAKASPARRPSAMIAPIAGATTADSQRNRPVGRGLECYGREAC